MPTVEEVCFELVSLHRQRTVVLGSRNMQANRLQAVVAGEIGYKSSMEEKDREKVFKEAANLIESIDKNKVDFKFRSIVKTTMIGIKALNDLEELYRKSMERWVKLLPVYKWSEEVEQRGFGGLSLAKVVGECGNLSNYANPAKVWRRMGCAPWEFNGLTLMGASWKSGKEGKLPAEEWSEYGYSPRRRSLAYLIGEGLMKQNDDGPYRARYDQAKADAIANRPDWTRCVKCGGKGKSPTGRAKCAGCKGEGKVLKRCHLHAMLLCTKLLLKNLWIEWHGHPPMLK